MKLTLGTAALLASLVTGPALAADMAARMPVKAPPLAPVPAFSWTGSYFGVNVGYGWGRQRTEFNAGFGGLGFGAEERQDVDGVFGGVQGGFNWQVGQFVLGIENDIQFSGQEGDTLYSLGFGFPGGPVGPTLAANHELRWFGTSRSRLGVTTWNNQMLFYVTGGAAYGQVRSTYDLGVGGFPVASLDTKNTRFGWTVGGGMEWAMAPNWSIKAEYLYLDLGREEASVAFLGTPALALESRFTDHIARIGANYRFPIGGAAPVMARY
ncbi:hypothetical protein RHODGE_RHODGE_00974 [Rhodoplanes serenus]|uniref:Outer membrane protein beta-barrel domain-containing protein n=1 Tax=Rhodoplanes serenus TaxID=200615 RepID=A0A447CRF8_9BRAD|nr:outer membrane protein [Rhodoplanes serenus]VCU07801.1 hypothetical protein RHODGE_RHODGE_00974 [Rhodoplanes serenus]